MIFRDILEKAPLQHRFRVRKEEEITGGRIRRIRGWGDHSHVFLGAKNFYIAPDHSEPTRPFSVIVLNVFGGSFSSRYKGAR
jgi:hypothetical protein